MRLRARLERLKTSLAKIEKEGARERTMKEQEFTIKDAMHKHSLNIDNKLVNTTVIYYPVFSFQLCLSGNTYSGSEGIYEGNIGLTKGWNIVPTLAFDDRDFSKNNFLAVYRFDNEKKSYISVFPEYDFAKTIIWSARYEKLIESFVGRFGRINIMEINFQDRDIGRLGSMFNSAMWVYANEDKAIDFGRPTDSGFFNYDVVRLTNGWNFLTISPDMIERESGKTIMDIKGSCNIEKAYTYGGDRGGWVDISSTEIESGLVWFGMIIKISNSECYLGDASSSIALPSIPGVIPTGSPASLEDIQVDENTKCYDSDISNDPYVKGKAVVEDWGLASYNDYCVYETDGTEGHYANVGSKFYNVMSACNVETDGTCLLVQTHCAEDKVGFDVSTCPGGCQNSVCV